MKIKFVTTAEPGHEGWKKFEKSLIRGGVPYHLIVQPWTGFGCKITGVQQYLQGAGSDVDAVVFADGNDSVFLGTWEEMLAKVSLQDWAGGLFSTEKNCWPRPDLEPKYPQNISRWRFLNAGGYLMTREKFLEIAAVGDPFKDNDDQFYYTERFLEGRFALDYESRIFQSVAFVSPDEFTYANGRVTNNLTGSRPNFIHGNGRTDLSKVYALLP